MVVEQAASATPTETRVAPDGFRYSWAEFGNYFDADIAAAIWEAAEVDAAPEPTSILTSPRFELGSIERVLPLSIILSLSLSSFPLSISTYPSLSVSLFLSMFFFLSLYFSFSARTHTHTR